MFIIKGGDVGNMYQSFWNKFYDFKLASYYYQLYALHARRGRSIVSALCMLASSALLAQMTQSASFRLGWVVIVFLCQLVSVLQPIFPFEKQYYAACNIYQDVNQLCDKMEAYWRTVSDNTTDKELNQEIISFSEQYDKIETRFATADLFPQKKRLFQHARDDADLYFRRFENE